MGITITRIIRIIMATLLATSTSITVTIISIMPMGFIMITMREEDTDNRYFIIVKHAREVVSIVFNLRLLWKVTITGKLRMIVLGLGG